MYYIYCCIGGQQLWAVKRQTENTNIKHVKPNLNQYWICNPKKNTQACYPAELHKTKKQCWVRKGRVGRGGGGGAKGTEIEGESVENGAGWGTG